MKRQMRNYYGGISRIHRASESAARILLEFQPEFSFFSFPTELPQRDEIRLRI
jgi:hypothetical protein